MAGLMLDELSARYLRVEYQPVSIDDYRDGNAGISYVWTYSAPLPGPHVVICGIMHGNEICGAVVLDRLLRAGVRPARGTLSFCFANPAAYERFDASHPHLNRDVDLDLNRVWGPELTDRGSNALEIERARELVPLFEDADYVLDLHSMQAAGPATAVVQDAGRTLNLAQQLTSVAFAVTGEVHDSALIRLRNYGRFGDPDATAIALQVEAGQHWRSETVEVAEHIARDFLETLGVVPKTTASTPVNQTTVEIVDIPRCHGPAFRFVNDFASGSFFPRAGTRIATEGDRVVSTPRDDCYLIMPVHFRRPSGTIGRFAVARQDRNGDRA